MTDPKYTLDKTIQDVVFSIKKGGGKFKHIYDRLDGRINQNSMFLYSGPFQNEKHHKHIFYNWRRYNGYNHYFNRRYHHNYHDKVACIYTGDGNLNVVKIRSIFRSYWNFVGTIQIPHHGDINSFDNQFLKDKYYFCPISVGTNNNYGHPSNTVVGEILSKRSIPVLVTDKLDDMFVEIIEQIARRRT